MKALKIKDVVEKVSLGQSTIYKMVAGGDFPKPFQIAPNRVAWVESEIDDWLAERASQRTGGQATDHGEQQPGTRRLGGSSKMGS